ncbi:MAG: type II secretion system protein GspG [Pirellulales bacterium]|nr:type II secretion system protein GspG [Pirellulales bacterium]
MSRDRQVRFRQYSLYRGGSRTHARRAAFTLIEVLLVLAILVILAGMAIGVYTGVQAGADIDNAKIEVKAIADAMLLYKTRHKQWPESLDVLVNVPSGMDVATWRGPYLNSVKPDPWGSDYIIGQPDQYDSKIEVLSAGPDRSQGTEDDISSFN